MDGHNTYMHITCALSYSAVVHGPVPIMDTSNSKQASGHRQCSVSEAEEGDIYVNYWYSHSSYPEGQVYYDGELLTGAGFSFETGASHYTRLGLPNQPSPSNTQASSSPDSVIHIDVS